MVGLGCTGRESGAHVANHARGGEGGACMAGARWVWGWLVSAVGLFFAPAVVHELLGRPESGAALWWYVGSTAVLWLASFITFLVFLAQRFRRGQWMLVVSAFTFVAWVLYVALALLVPRSLALLGIVWVTAISWFWIIFWFAAWVLRRVLVGAMREARDEATTPAPSPNVEPVATNAAPARPSGPGWWRE